MTTYDTVSDKSSSRPLLPQLSSEPDGCVSGDCCDINRICDRLHGCSHSEHHPSLPGQSVSQSVSQLISQCQYDSVEQ